jgi:hypothetical protein
VSIWLVVIFLIALIPFSSIFFSFLPCPPHFSPSFPPCLIPYLILLSLSLSLSLCSLCFVVLRQGLTVQCRLAAHCWDYRGIPPSLTLPFSFSFSQIPTGTRANTSLSVHSFALT